MIRLVSGTTGMKIIKGTRNTTSEIITVTLDPIVGWCEMIMSTEKIGTKGLEMIYELEGI